MHPDNRITSEIMTSFEYTQAVSMRARQIELGGPVYASGCQNITNPIIIAEREIEQKKCPLSIIRMITDVIAEKWDINEMAIPAF